MRVQQTTKKIKPTLFYPENNEVSSLYFSLILDILFLRLSSFISYFGWFMAFFYGQYLVSYMFIESFCLDFGRFQVGFLKCSQIFGDFKESIVSNSFLGHSN